MGKKKAISPALRAKLLKQKKSMKTGGVIIKNSEFEKGRLRILPCGDDTPGIPYHSFYVRTKDFAAPEDDEGNEKRGSASPHSWGMRCPIREVLAKLRKGNVEQKELAKTVNSSTEYWMPVIDREDEGDASAPEVKIFCAKTKIYNAIINMLMDEDDGEDITDSVDGCDLRVKKTGKGLKTEWTATKLESGAIHDDETMAEAILKAGDDMDVVNSFYPIKWEVLEAIYEYLTGDEMPEWYKEQTPSGGEEGGEVEDDYEEGSAEDDAPVEETTDNTTDDDTAEEPIEEAAPEEEAVDEELIPIGTRVSFDDGDGGTITGEICGIAENGTDNLIKGDGDSDDEMPWELATEALTIIPVEKKTRKPSRKPKLAVKKEEKKPESKGGKKDPRKPASGSASSKIANRSLKRSKSK